MVSLKVIPTSLLFIHRSAGHCNLETAVCGCVCQLACFHQSRRKKARHGEGGEGRCGLEYGFGFPSFRGELKSIDTEAESEADRVAAQGCTSTRPEHDLHAPKVTSPTPHRMWWCGGDDSRRLKRKNCGIRVGCVHRINACNCSGCHFLSSFSKWSEDMIKEIREE